MVRMPDPRKHTYDVGDRIGLLTVLGFELIKRPDGRNRRIIEVRCDCGTVKKVLPYNLASGDTKSCGCLHRRKASESNTTHGARSKSATTKQKRLLSVWRGMNQRCNNPMARNYKWYGNKGVQIEWKSFDEFYSWAINNGYNEGLEIDRIDPSGNYNADNCIWSTKGDNIARAHMDIDQDLLIKATRVAASTQRTLSEVIEEALSLFLDGGEGV